MQEEEAFTTTDNYVTNVCDKMRDANVSAKKIVLVALKEGQV
jgi:hypothetical protein